jgi:cytochrome c biogenesis protein CcdA
MKVQTLHNKMFAAAGTVLVLLLVATIAVASRSPQWTTALAGGLLLAAGFIVMAPCQLQMAASLTLVIKNLAARRAQTASAGLVRGTALRFALGYLVFYLPIATGLGVIALLLGRYAWVLTMAGGAMALVLGLSALGLVRYSWLAQCRGPLWLIRSGRASFQHPFRAGIAFGQYCAACCGPYVYALIVLAGATTTFWLGSGLVMLYAITMVIPFLLPVLLTPAVYATVSKRLQELTPHIGQATGYMLIGLGILLIPLAALMLGH